MSMLRSVHLEIPIAVALALVWVASGASCGDSSSTDGNSTESTTTGKSKPGPAQGLSEECDASLGKDACGAGLFCAAFDGRTITTCYTERSRLEGQECGENIHCGTNYCDNNVCSKKPGGEPCEMSAECESGICNMNTGECQAVPSTTGSSGSSTSIATGGGG